MPKTIQSKYFSAPLIMIVFFTACGKQPDLQITAMVSPSETSGLIPTTVSASTLQVHTPTTVYQRPSPTPFPLGQFPIGTFTKDDHDGHWLISFKADGSFTTKLNGLTIASVATYTVQEDQVTLIDDSTVCEGKGEGVYAWSVKENQLSFVAISDKCSRRRATMNNAVWIFVP